MANLRGIIDWIVSIRKRRIIMILLITLPFWSWVFWLLQTRKEVNVLIVDKTVPVLKRNEHRSFDWVLTHHKYVKPDKSLYSINEDYKGFFPLKPIEKSEFEIHDLDKYTEEQLDSISKTIDMLYFTDTYGVYYNEWYLHKWETEHSRKVYGGLSNNDLNLIRRMKDKKKLVIGEYNFIASPTSYGVRKSVEKLYDFRWTGWTGRYFDLLDTIKNPELPRWVIQLYKEQHHNQWPFKKSGIVFVHIDETLEILENETHLTIETPYLYTFDYGQKKYDLPKNVHYPYWFDITYTGTSNRIISYYKIFANAKGDSILRRFHIPDVIPCVFEHLAKDDNDYTFYYFGGDFADNPIRYLSTYFRGVEYIGFLLYNNQANERTKFFYKFYYPMMNVIMKDYYKKLEKKRNK